MTLLLLYVALAVGVSFLCSIMEAVLLSITPSYVAALEDENPVAGARIRELKSDIERPLAAILTLNTFAHTLGAAGAGAQATIVFGSAYIGAFSLVLTLIILVASEIIPKTLGAIYWRQLASPVARLLKPTIWILYPLVVLSKALTKLLARGAKEARVSRAELAALARLGVEEGVFEKQESRILQSLFRFNELTARDVMTPRTVMIAVSEDTLLQEMADRDIPFSRIPLFQTDRDHITGFVLKSDLLQALADDRHDVTAGELSRPILTVPDTLPLPRLFDRLLERQEHIALVVGEYGGTAGLATVEDVVETLLGTEIVDEADTEHDMQAAAREQWRQRAMRLGILDEDGNEAQAGKERKAGIELGLTGGVTPVTTDLPDAPRQPGAARQDGPPSA
ncbi:CNNM domain-containing protein [soil metagenome]